MAIWQSWLGLAALWLASAAGAQVANPAPNPSLKATVNGVRDEANARALSLRRFDVTVELRGAVAETTVEASFANNLPEALEGDFRFALPRDAVVTGYALDVAGQMVDGVLVDRPHAKAVYEERIRRGIDPGLAEVAPDGTFETRVFPIRPGAGRLVRLRFVSPVDGQTGFHLPIAIDAPTEGWSISVHATGTAARPTVTLPGGSAIAAERTDDGFRFKLAGGAEALAGDLVIAAAPQPAVLVSMHRNGERDVQLSGDLPAGISLGHPERVRVYWDRSRSRLASDLAGEQALLRKFISAMHPGSLELVAFNSSGAKRHIATSADDAEAWLKTVQYRGATSFASIAHDGAADECLLFSDGKATVDRDTIFAPRCRLDAVSSTPDADRPWLRHAATSHGGHAYALDAESAAEVLVGLTTLQRSVTAVLDQDGRSLPFVPLDTAAGRWMLLAHAPEAGPVVVRLGGVGAPLEVRQSIEGDGLAFDGAGALVASDQLALLGGTEQRAQYIALSRRYGIASPSLSFVVLELPSDYQAAEVEPPANYPSEARDTFLRLHKQADASAAEEKRTRMNTVIAEWNDEVAWWKTRFDPAARPKRVAISRAFDQTAPGAPPPPPPALVLAPAPIIVPAAPPAPNAPRAGGDVVVTGARTNRGAAAGVAGISADDIGSLPDLSSGEALQRVPGPGASVPRIAIEAWQPDRPYLELFDGAPVEFDKRFLEAEARHGSIPAFYLDTAEWLRKRGRTADAIEMVLSALELPTADEVTLGIVADRLERYGAVDRAVELRERQIVLDPDRPQPKRLLALALARRAETEPSSAKADLARAISLLSEVATSPLDPRWNGIDLVSLVEANSLVPKLNRLGGKSKLDPRLTALLDVDMRVVVDWTTDGTDLDLWVDEPDGERAIYNNQRTAIGGHLSDDMTNGYGPEEYLLHRARGGTYVVQANVYATDRIDPNGASVLTAHLFRNYGRSTQKEESIDVELIRDTRGAKMIGRVVVPSTGKAH